MLLFFIYFPFEFLLCQEEEIRKWPESENIFRAVSRAVQ